MGLILGYWLDPRRGRDADRPAVGCVGALLLAARAASDGEGEARASWLDGGGPIDLAGLALAGQVALTSIFDLRIQRETVPPGEAIAFAAAVGKMED